ncbi:cysteine--tRNA ligase [Paenarthrobacter sp. DKR-5]|uniref:cysteine--tRNA ligase n=1 Tax=Paenarthrobacter sp. DKR-5 TaxID=2835535 RepID=UPI001BDBE9E9|nr:cysteine--tRNA ligase [Paenarthrobacter sp. DKR-5]MBT1003627.1 cysteine--tRNA ligase [Paenarthrobacter sp. DKR-5]
MTLRFYDTATAEVRNFVPLHEGRASVYYCGATVQGEPHIGHLRSALVFDQLTRWLEYSGYRTTVIRNVTDIDDKILAKALDGGENWWALAYRFEQAFEDAYDALGVGRPDYEPRATGHIPEMHRLIQELIDGGHAYPALDGSGDVYFDVRSWGRYGSLTHQSVEEMQDAPDADPRGKRDPRDFALWKGHKESEPESAAWTSPWGAGRPGWHLECSAMAGKYLGDAFDIHGGGLDLRFPHHENEMAQSQASGRAFATFWLHNGLVTYAGEKMSKSIGNTVGPRDLFEQARPLVVRYYLGQAQYRSVLDYRPESLTEAAAAVERIEGFMLKGTRKLGSGWTAPDRAEWAVPEYFAAAMDDDLNIPAALAVVHESVRAGNTALAAGDDDAVRQALADLTAMLGVLNINPLDEHWSDSGGDGAAHRALDALVRSRLDERRQARADKDWARADRIRDALAAAGISVEDTADGADWSLGTGAHDGR